MERNIVRCESCGSEQSNLRSLLYTDSYKVRSYKGKHETRARCPYCGSSKLKILKLET